jgi:phosphate transport system substrate-binding protein
MVEHDGRRGLGGVALMILLLLGIAALAVVAWKPEVLMSERRVTVVIEPREAIVAGGAWKIGGGWMDVPEAAISDANRRQRIEFRPVPGWISPESVELSATEVNQHVRGEYVRQVLTEKTILRLHGSNTIGANLGPELAERYLRWLGAESVRTVAGSDPVERAVEGVFSARGEVLRIDIKAHGSSTGFKDMLGGACDIAMSSRRIKDKERESLKHLGDMTSYENEYVVALDGIAVIVHKSNPLEKLTRKQIADIFAGRITNWQDLGLPPGAIEIHARDDESGTFDTFQNLVLGDDKLAATAIRYESNAELSDRVADTPLAIGFCGLPYINRSKELAVQDEGLAIKPSMFSVSTEDYPLARRLYLYATRQEANLHVRQFLEYSLDREGQEAVGKFGFVSLDISGQRASGSVRKDAAPLEVAAVTETFGTAAPEPEKVLATQVGELPDVPAVDAKVMQVYRNAVQGGERLPVNFRFQFGSFELDNKALRDLERVAELSRTVEGQGVVLIGFSDSVGDYGQNLILSKRRAQTVADRLIQLGVEVRDVVGASEEAPVASNDDPAGRERNRRVEVWLR